MMNDDDDDDDVDDDDDDIDDGEDDDDDDDDVWQISDGIVFASVYEIPSGTLGIFTFEPGPDGAPTIGEWERFGSRQ